MIDKIKIETTLADLDGCVTAAAYDLGVPVRSLYNAMRHHAIDPDTYRPANRQRGKMIFKICFHCGKSFTRRQILELENRGSEQIGDIIVDFYLCDGNMPLEELREKNTIVPCGATLSVVRN
jgi:hypothetical protein